MYPLVSVVVLSYNSSLTILETLDSIYKQTYDNIELIISDDFSTDNTKKMVYDWLENHQERFSKVKFICSQQNTGTSANLNRGINNSSGSWIKIIAADDILLPNCVEDSLSFVLLNGYSIIQAREVFIDSSGKEMGYDLGEILRMKKLSLMNSAEEQYRYLLSDDVRLSPTLFFSRNAFYKVGGCDERIRNIEDYPLKLKFLYNGFKMGFLDVVTVCYRISNSISHSTELVYSEKHLIQKYKLKKLCCNPYIPWFDFSYWVSEFLEHFQEKVVIKIFHNKRTFLARCLMRIIHLIHPRQIEKNKLIREYNKSNKYMR